MPKTDTDYPAAWQLFIDYRRELHGLVEKNMRRLRVPWDPAAVNDIAYDACVQFYKRPADMRPGEPLGYLVVIVRHLTLAKYCRSPKLSSVTHLNTMLVPITDASDEDLTPHPRDPTDDLALEIDISAGLSAMANDKPEEHQVLSGKLYGKSTPELQEELGTDRHRVNNLLRRARAYLRDLFNDRENES